jgi:hypothetical protein
MFWMRRRRRGLLFIEYLKTAPTAKGFSFGSAAWRDVYFIEFLTTASLRYQGSKDGADG